MIPTRFIASLIVLMLAVGCKQASPTDPAAANLTIPGTYKIAQLTANDGQLYDYIQLAKDEKNTCFSDLTLTFRSDGTLTTNNGLACDKAAFFPDLTKTYASATWSLTGSTLTLSYQEVVVTPITINEKWTLTAAGNMLSLTRALNSVDTMTGKPIVVTHKMDLVRQ